MGNTFGRAFRVTTWGESHGKEIGAVIDGCPPNIEIYPEHIATQMARRRPGQSKLVTQRKETDAVEIVSGLENNITLGTPIALRILNKDARPNDYDKAASAYRPSHADFTYQEKYGIRASSGGGRASARETAARVAAGAIASQVLEHFGVKVLAWVSAISDIEMAFPQDLPSPSDVEQTEVRCPAPETAAAMRQAILDAKKAGDSLGGVVTAVATGVPTGLGEPVFDKLDAELAKAMLSLPAAKGFEVGSGFAGTKMTGSQHNDPFVVKGDNVGTSSNYSGGIQGGISNGEPITLRVAFKPTATIMKPQNTVDDDQNSVILQPKGRHDPCVLPRAVPIVEAMMAMVLVDHILRQRGQTGRP